MKDTERYKKMIGLFITGSLKNGCKFFGECLSVDGDFLHLSGEGDNPPQRLKLVRISEITEMIYEPMRRDL